MSNVFRGLKYYKYDRSIKAKVHNHRLEDYNVDGERGNISVVISCT
jgi:hypothetical protein